jgi:hypothetical protein
VKRKYTGKKYRACSTRCCEILDNLEDASEVETLHLVYLHFYAASSSEMYARPLSQSSTYRRKLLRDARDHYGLATALIKKADDEIVQKTGSASTNLFSPQLLSTSTSSSPRSSTISNTSTSSSRTSVSSADDMAAKASRMRSSSTTKPKRKKKVSFSGLPDVIEIPKLCDHNGPYIRPDSPTLGFEEDFFSPGPLKPEVPEQPRRQAPAVAEVNAASPRGRGNERAILPPLEESPMVHKTNEDRFDLEAFIQAKSMKRVRAQLTDLRDQVSFHRDGVDALLAETDVVPMVPTVPATPEMPPVPALTSHWRSSLASTTGTATPEPESPRTPLFTTMSPPHMMDMVLPLRHKASWSGMSTPDIARSRSPSISSTRPDSAASNYRDGDEAIQRRIERLRAQGWQRKRFDSRRYEALREQVLGELGP